RPGSVIHFNRDGMRQLAPLVEVLATKEGLTGHRESVRVRM
ncbi:MAG: histidinol dehydrogenase, partial [Thermoguttaceae bacterium]|nr:histidinol dehydrogenase [Thermoguttaceae bacterium]